VQPAFVGLTDLFRVRLAIWDRRTRGRLHPVTLWGVLSIVSQPLRLVVSGTESWLAFARWAIGRSVRTRLPRMVFQVSRALALEDDERRPLAAGSSRSQPSTLTGQSSRTKRTVRRPAMATLQLVGQKTSAT